MCYNALWLLLCLDHSQWISDPFLQLELHFYGRQQSHETMSNVYVSVDKKTETLSMLSVCFDSVHSSMCHSCYLCKIPFLRYLKIALLGGGGIKICNPAFNAVVLLFSQFSPLCRENCFCSLLQPVPLLASHDFLKKSFFGIFFFTLLLLCDELQSGSVSISSQLLSQSAYCT